MSAWYVLTTLGLYPVVPASGRFVTAMPQVVNAKLALAKGHSLVINRKGNPRSGQYADHPLLNGRKLGLMDLTYSDLIKGGALDYALISRPIHAPRP